MRRKLFLLTLLPFTFIIFSSVNGESATDGVFRLRNQRDYRIHLTREIKHLFNPEVKRFSVSLVDPESGFQLHIRPHRKYPSASTMKVGVMLSLYRLAQKRRINLNKKIPVRNKFRSVIRRRPYKVPKEEKEDCACTTYKNLGGRLSLRELNNDMIRSSSNLATNLLIKYIGKRRIARELKRMRIKGFWISRGLYDMHAFRRNWHNKLTAHGTYRSLFALTNKRYFNSTYKQEMLSLLSTTEHRDKIPAMLPPGIKVAQKSGRTDDVSHDAAIIYPTQKTPYYLVFLTEDYKDQILLEEAMAKASKTIFEGILDIRKRRLK